MTSDKITLKVHEEFTISLKSFATAGYLWKIQTIPDAIRLIGTENEKSAHEVKPGDSTTQIFRFRALKAGEYKIMFILARPWEDQALESHTVIVKTE